MWPEFWLPLSWLVKGNSIFLYGEKKLGTRRFRHLVPFVLSFGFCFSVKNHLDLSKYTSRNDRLRLNWAKLIPLWVQNSSFVKVEERSPMSMGVEFDRGKLWPHDRPHDLACWLAQWWSYGTVENFLDPIWIATWLAWIMQGQLPSCGAFHTLTIEQQPKEPENFVNNNFQWPFITSRTAKTVDFLHAIVNVLKQTWVDLKSRPYKMCVRILRLPGLLFNQDRVAQSGTYYVEWYQITLDSFLMS